MFRKTSRRRERFMCGVRTEAEQTADNRAYSTT